MKIRIYFIFCLLCTLSANRLLANAKGITSDKGDTVKGKPKPVAKYYTEAMMAPYNLWMQSGWQKKRTVDTNLDNFQYYSNRYTLGNTGLPYVPMTFDNPLQPMGFFYGNDYVSNNFYNDSTVKYFDARAPYTRFYYVSDPQIHQFFELTHAQNIGQKFDIAASFKRIRSEGIYFNQGTNLNQLLLTANYHSKRYHIFMDAIYDVYKFQQNGGIQADTFLRSKYFTDRLTVPVNLSYANTAMYERSVHIKQYYFLGYRGSDSDKEKPLFYISTSSRVAGHSNVYTDQNGADSGFYTNFYYDSLTYDSLRYNEITNNVSIGSGKGWNAPVKWELGATQQWVHFKDYELIPQSVDYVTVYNRKQLADTFFNNYTAHARLYNAFDSGKIVFDASGQYTVKGNLQGDMQGVVQLGWKFDSLRFIKLSGTYSYQDPPYLYNFYNGNNFIWKNELSKVETSSLKFDYCDNKWKLDISLSATTITNMVYFDSTASPMQYQPAINVYCAAITKDFKVYRFHWNTTEKLQVIPDNLPLRLPKFITENSFFYEGNLFQKHLLLRIGVDIYWNSSYYGYAYMPVFDQYYLENTQKLGNYVYFEPFVSFRIKTFRMFIKYENATEGLVPYSYFYALHYPTTDATLRFGISWDFWN